MLQTIFILLGSQKVDLFAPQEVIKCTLLPASKKNNFTDSKTNIHHCKKYRLKIKWFFRSRDSIHIKKIPLIKYFNLKNY